MACLRSEHLRKSLYEWWITTSQYQLGRQTNFVLQNTSQTLYSDIHSVRWQSSGICMEVRTLARHQLKIKHRTLRNRSRSTITTGQDGN